MTVSRHPKIVFCVIPLLLVWDFGSSFTIISSSRAHATAAKRNLQLWALPEISRMKPREIRQELESYGISTKSFLEKSELIDALEEARASGATVKTKTTKRDRSSKVNGDTKATDEFSRATKIKEQMEKAQSMKVQELKKELQARGVSTKSFFEKSEFVRAYAEAVVDGKKTSSKTKKEEAYDPSYKDVVVQKMNARDPRVLQGTIIDIKVQDAGLTRKSQCAC